MKKHFWKTEYSITLVVIFAAFLFLLPTSWLTVSKQAAFISKWNETFDKTDYMFSAMAAQADSEIVKSLKNAKTPEIREQLMIKLIEPYLRLQENDRILKYYHPRYMNGQKVKKGEEYFFENIYIADNGHIVGIKELSNKGKYQPAFIMLFDVNGITPPNKWGEDIYGINVYQDGAIKALGDGWDLDRLKKDCQDLGSGISCSHYYRIGGEFNG